MKVFLRYEDNEDETLHKSLKITLPKSWKKGPTSKLLQQFVDSYNASEQGEKSPLPETAELHLAISKDEDSNDNNTNTATESKTTPDEEDDEKYEKYESIPSDAIVLDAIPDRYRIFVRHGPSPTVARKNEILSEKRRRTEERKRAERERLAKTVPCLHFGCTNRFDPTKPPPECVYHKSPPVFHETAKFWSCCPGKKAYDFEDFQNIPGCMKGYCTDHRDENDAVGRVLGGCDMREKLNGGGSGAVKLKSIDDFNSAEEAGGSKATPVLSRLKEDFGKIGIEAELFDQVVEGIRRKIVGDEEVGEKQEQQVVDSVAKELGEKLKSAMKNIAVEQLRIK